MSLFPHANSPLTALGPARRRARPGSLYLLVRCCVGILFIANGVNGLMGFSKQLDTAIPLTEHLHATCSSAGAAILMGLQILGGMGLMSGRFVNLGLLILGPIVTQFLFCHLQEHQEALWLAIVLMLAVTYLTWRNRQAWLALLSSAEAR
jgi:uncharacterized membrane protein YphA (DoxX/SURF4 family)